MTPVNFDTIYIFGDSYSDTGASGGAPGTTNGPRTNGGTAASYLAAAFGSELALPGDSNIGTKSINFAETSAKVATQTSNGPTSLSNQVDNLVDLVGDGKASFDSDDTMFFLAGGLNDSSTGVSTVTNGYREQVADLVALGAQYIQIALLPSEMGSSKFANSAAKFNPAYTDLVAELSAQYSGISITLSDWGNYFDTVITNPGNYGFTNTTGSYVQDAQPGDNPDDFFFYYIRHPGDAAHEIVGNMLYQESLTIEALPPLPTIDDLVISGADFGVTSFAQQNANSDFDVTNSGTTLELGTNAWVEATISGGITVTRDTVLRFDFHSTDEGEMHGVEFDSNNRATSSDGFQLFGEQTWYRQDYNNYQLSDGVKTYEIEVGKFFRGTFDSIVFFTDDDFGTSSNSVFSNIELFERGANAAPTGDQGNVSAEIGDAISIDLTAAFSDSDGPQPLSFNVSGLPSGLSLTNGVITGSTNETGTFDIDVTVSDGQNTINDRFDLTVIDPNAPVTELLVSGQSYALSSFVQQNANSDYAVADGGLTLEQQTNAWTELEIPGNFRVTSNTVLRFDFESTDEGEMHGFEFDKNDRATSEHGFQLFGEQAWYRQDFNNYQLSDGVKSYEIPVGQYFTGRFDNIVFFTDDDFGTSSNSVFSNIELIDIA